MVFFCCRLGLNRCWFRSLLLLSSRWLLSYNSHRYSSCRYCHRHRDRCPPIAFAAVVLFFVFRWRVCWRFCWRGDSHVAHFFFFSFGSIFFVRPVYSSRVRERHRSRIVGLPPRGSGALAMEIDVGERGESAMALDKRPQPFPRREIFLTSTNVLALFDTAVWTSTCNE